MGTVPLSESATRSIGFSLDIAIRTAKDDEVLVKAAISKSVRDAVTTYGADSAAAIAAAVIVTAEGDGARMDEIGAGLAQAAAALAPESCKGTGGNPVYDCRIAATAIAQTVGNEARTAEAIAFQRAVIDLKYPKLALIAGEGSAPTSAIPPGLAAGLGGGFAPGGGAGGGCLTASCTQF